MKTNLAQSFERRKPKKSLFQTWEGLLYLLPFFIPYCIFTLVMLVEAFGLSFMDYKIFGGSTFIGWKNYKVIFNDPVFWTALKNTVLFVTFSTPVFVIAAFLVALLLEYKFLKHKTFFRASFVMPMVLPVSVVATIGLYMFQPYVGLINGMLKTAHILGADQEIFWIGDADLVWVTITMLTLWWANGFNVVLYLAGMQDISDTYYESAQLDGANYFQQVRHITWPLLARTHLSILFLQLVASFKIYGQAYIMTSGGPDGASRTIIQYMWEMGFRTFNIGRASAVAVVLFLIIFVVSGAQYTVSAKTSKL